MRDISAKVNVVGVHMGDILAGRMVAKQIPFLSYFHSWTLDVLDGVGDVEFQLLVAVVADNDFDDIGVILATNVIGNELLELFTIVGGDNNRTHLK